jgi:hypothetical protein
MADDLTGEPITPERMEWIRKRDSRYPEGLIENDMGSPIICAQDRRDLLAEVERLRAQVVAVKRVAARHDRSRGACVCSLCAALRDVHAWSEHPTVSELASGDDPRAEAWDEGRVSGLVYAKDVVNNPYRPDGADHD